MKRLVLFSGMLIAASLAACLPSAPRQPPVTGTAMDSSSSSSARYATVEGVLQKAGVGIYMQGTHRLQMYDGTFLLLQSSTVRLDDYINARIVVTGRLQPTAETGGMIMNVEIIEAAEAFPQPEILAEDGPKTTSSASSSALAMNSIPASSFPAPLPIRSFYSTNAASSYSARSSSSSAQPVSLPPASSSSSAGVVDVSSTIKAMARVASDSAAFTTKYCSSHIGFCFPMHKHWFYKSFGASVSPYLWHVEVSDQSVEEAGQGVIVLNLVSGALVGPEGEAVVRGDFVVASRQWTGNRRFEISGPKELIAAVEFMASGLEVYQSPQTQ